MEDMYKGCLKSLWTGGSVPPLCRGRWWLMPSCSDWG